MKLELNMFFNKYFKSIMVSLFLLISGICSAQNTTTELVFLRDNNLKKLLNSIITIDNSCRDESKEIAWIIDFKDEDEIVVTRSRIANLLEATKNQKMSLTVINDRIVFAIEMKNKSYSNSGILIDLTNYHNKEVLLFEDFSAWQLKKSQGKYSIIAERIFKCD